MKRTIEISVSPTGEIQVEAQGFTGKTCKEATRALEEALGKVGKFQPKPEFHRMVRRTSQQKVGL